MAGPGPLAAAVTALSTYSRPETGKQCSVGKRNGAADSAEELRSAVQALVVGILRRNLCPIDRLSTCCVSYLSSEGAESALVPPHHGVTVELLSGSWRH